MASSDPAVGARTGFSTLDSASDSTPTEAADTEHTADAAFDPAAAAAAAAAAATAAADSATANDGDAASPTRDRRMSKEWDASKVPPSRFQRRAGSIYSTQSTRDGHVKGPERDQAYFDKLREKVGCFAWLRAGAGTGAA